MRLFQKLVLPFSAQLLLQREYKVGFSLSAFVKSEHKGISFVFSERKLLNLEAMNKKILFLMLVIGLQACSDDEKIPQEPPVLLNEQDSLAIVDIYNETGGGSDWARSWDLHDHKTWYTVKIKQVGHEYRVVGFQLADYFPGQPSGTVPESVCNLTELEDLFIASERLFGGLPENIDKLTKLKRLTVVKTHLNKLPPEVGKLSQLEKLELTFSDFRGNLPKELGNLPPETKIWIHHNHFSGTVPLEVLKNRKEITLEHNDFTELLWECWLHEEYGIPSMLYNRLSGEVPDSVLASERWKILKGLVSPQQDGYGYTIK